DDNTENIENKDSVQEEAKKPAPKKRKTKASEEDATPLATRTPVESMKRKLYIGAHVSSAGGMSSHHPPTHRFVLFTSLPSPNPP
nr:hypothetical protein [Escherichia coli]